MVVVADASVAIRGDMSGFHSDLNRAKAETGTLGDKLRNALSPRNIIAGAGLLGITVGLRNLIGFAGDAAGEFQDLQQTVQTVDQVFGDSAGVIHDWGERAAGAAGLSKREVNEAAAVMGQTLRNMGFDAEDAADQVVTLQQRAADLALAMGKDPQDAILAFSAALRGERDTIEKFGVTLTEGLVDARIEALNLDTSTPALERYATAVATLSLVMEQSEGSAGRFADGQDNVSVKIAQAKANAENFELQFGQMVTEIENGAFIVGDAIGDAAGAVGNFFDEADDPRLHQLAETLGITWGDALHMVRQAQDDTGQNWDSTVDGMLMSAYELGEEGAGSFDHFTGAFTQMALNVQGVASGVGEVVAFAIPRAILFHWDQIRQAGVDTMTAYKAGIFDSQDSFLSEIDALLLALDEHLAPAEEFALLRGKKIDLMLARGIAEAKGDDGAVAAIDLMIEQINNRLNTLNGYQWGWNLADTIDQGMKDRVKSGISGAYALGTVIRKGVGINSEPEDHNSPLYGITKWGGNIVKTIAEGITGELDTGAAASRALAGALAPSLGGMSNGVGMPMLGGPGGTTYVLQVNGVQYEVSSAEEAIETLTGLGVFGEGRLN